MAEKTPLDDNLYQKAPGTPERTTSENPPAAADADPFRPIPLPVDPPLQPVGRYALVQLLLRPQKAGSLYVPTAARRSMALEGEAAAPGLRAVGRVLATSPAFEEAVPGLVGEYVVVVVDGGRGAHADGRRVFYTPEEVVGVVVGDGDGEGVDADGDGDGY